MHVVRIVVLIAIIIVVGDAFYPALNGTNLFRSIGSRLRDKIERGARGGGNLVFYIFKLLLHSMGGYLLPQASALVDISLCRHGCDQRDLFTGLLPLM
jgi:hypothetical protein